MAGSVDHLEVRRTPEPQELGPREVPVVSPNLVKGHDVIDLGGPKEPLLRYRAGSALSPTKGADVLARCRPEFPGDHAGRVPPNVSAGLAVGPEIEVRAVAEDRLATDAAVPGTLRESLLAVGSWRNPELFGSPQPPGWGAGPCRKRPRETIGPEGVLAPVGVDREARRGWDERSAKSMHHHAFGEDRR